MYKRLAHKVVDNAAPDTLYIVPPGAQAIVRGIKVLNKGGVATTVKLWHGGTADGDIILPEVTLDPGDFGEFDGVVTMQAGETLVGQAGAAGSIVASAYGLEKS